MLIRTFVILALLAAAPAAAQSFDCARAQTRIEKMVCADRSIAELDEYLGRYYAAARDANRPAASCLQADQAAWLKTRRDACPDAACVKAAYLDRLAELDPLQPGVTAIRNLPLPRVPSLVWIIPPASDRVAAPPNPKAVAFEATGTIVDDIATNPDSEGIVLRTADGTRIPLMMLMFLEAPSQERLTALAKLGGRYQARGFAVTDSSGRRSFEPSRCTFLHRLP